MKSLLATRVAGLFLPAERTPLSVGADGAILFHAPPSGPAPLPPEPRGAPPPGGSVLHAWTPRGPESVAVPEPYVGRVPPTLQRRAGADWLVVRPFADQHNLHVFGLDGRSFGSLSVGPSVFLLQATAGGLVWVTYGEEGILGDPSLASAALNGFDLQGRRLFRFDRLAKQHGLLPIFNSYWLNVASERTAWAYYSDGQGYALVRLTDLALDGHWRVPVREARAMAVVGGAAVFVGTYAERSALTLVPLGSLEAEPLRLLDAEGRDVAFTDAYGRGSRLYFEAGDAVYLADLRSL